MVKVLVTGGAGYLGSILVERLLSWNYEVVVLDNFMYKQTSLNHLFVDKRMEVIRGDARDIKLVQSLMKTASIVIPLAAIVGAPACDRDKDGAVSTNYSAIQGIANCLGDGQYVILPVTNSGYGIGTPDELCTEESPLNPVSSYGQMKVAAESLIMEKENAISLRLATVFGMSPRMRFDLLVNDFVNRAVNDRAVVLFEPHFKRNYIHVRDVAGAFIHVLRRLAEMKGEVYNVGLTSANMSKWQLCEVIQQHVPEFVFLEAPVGEDPDKRDYIVSNDKIEATGWTSKHSLDDGVRELVRGCRVVNNLRHGNY